MKRWLLAANDAGIFLLAVGVVVVSWKAVIWCLRNEYLLVAFGAALGCIGASFMALRMLNGWGEDD